MPRRRTAPVPRKAPRQERARPTIDAIVTAVERVLEQHGAGGLTTNRVAEVAGVSIGTLYEWFPNKEALVAALQERYIAQTLGLCRAVLAAAGAIPLAQVCDRIADALVLANRTQRPIHGALADLRSAAAFQERWRAALLAIADEVAGFLRGRADARADVTDDPAAAGFVVVHAIAGMVEGIGIHTARVDVAATARAGARMIARYLTAS